MDLSLTRRNPLDVLFEITVLALVFSLPFGGYHVRLGSVTVSITNFLLVACSLTLIMVALFERRLEFERSQIVAILGTSLFIVLYLLAIVAQNGSFQWLRTRFGRWLVLIVIVGYVDSFRAMERVLWMSFLAAVAAGTLTILSSVFHIPIGARFYEYRAVAGFRIPFVRTLGVKGLTFGVFGVYLLVATPYFAVKAAIGRGGNNTSALVTVVLFTIFVIQSRAVWVSTLFIVGVLLTVYLLRWHEFFPPVFSILGRVAIVIGVLLSPLLIHILIRVKPTTFYTRIEQYYNSIQIMGNHPLWGLGPGNVIAHPEFSLLPHNAFLRIGVESGVLAFLLFVAIYIFATVQIVRGMFHAKTPSEMALPAGLFSALAAAAIISSLQPSFGKATWMILGAAVSYNRTLN